MMKTKIRFMLASSLFFIVIIANAQTWSQGSNEIRTGIPNGGLGGASAANGSLLFYNSTNSNTVGIQSGTTTATYNMTLPTAVGSAGDVLQTSSTGLLSWASVSGIANVYEISYTVISDSLLTIVGRTDTIIVAPGTGKYIEVISASVYLSFNTAAYIGENSFMLRSAGATQVLAGCSGILNATSSRGHMFSRNGGSDNDTQLLENKALVLDFQSDSGNPTSGNSSIKIKVMYRIVTI